MPSESERLSEADACHDAEPQRAAAMLRDIDVAALAADERPLCAFLLNHVLGEKLGDWRGAQHRQSALLAAAAGAAPAVLWRQAAVAATLAADAAAAASASAGLARAASVSAAQAQELVALAAAGFTLPTADALRAGGLALAALQALDAAHWQQASALDMAAAACCNNIAAELSERPPSDLRDASLRDALLRAALASQRLWRRAGNWVNHERACYGVAVAAGAAGDAKQQLHAVTEGLALLDREDRAREQTVDRAFLELESEHAHRRLRRYAAAAAARQRADALVAGFGDASLTRWFEARVERHRQLDAAG
jgi:hypothetical protein